MGRSGLTSLRIFLRRYGGGDCSILFNPLTFNSTVASNTSATFEYEWFWNTYIKFN